jgi:hypothetical protein
VSPRVRAHRGFGCLLVETGCLRPPTQGVRLATPPTDKRLGILSPVGWGPLVTKNAPQAHADGRLPSCALIAPDRVSLKAVVHSREVKRLRCYLGFHRWRRFRSDDGGKYAKCTECGKFQDLDDQRPPLGPESAGAAVVGVPASRARTRVCEHCGAVLDTSTPRASQGTRRGLALSAAMSAPLPLWAAQTTGSFSFNRSASETGCNSVVGHEGVGGRKVAALSRRGSPHDPARRSRRGTCPMSRERLRVPRHVDTGGRLDVHLPGVPDVRARARAAGRHGPLGLTLRGKSKD